MAYSPVFLNFSIFNVYERKNIMKKEQKDNKKTRNPQKSKPETPLEMDQNEIGEERDEPIIPDDPIEAEQIESEKLRFGFSFEPKEGQTGDETEDEGDLTAEQRKTGNRYRPSMGVDDGEKDDSEVANDQDLHITDTGHIGMAYEEDSYVEDSEERKGKNK